MNNRKHNLIGETVVFIGNMIDFFKKLVKETEDFDLPIYYFGFTFIFSSTLRIFLDFFSYRTEINLIMLLYYYLFYAAIGLSAILLVHIFTREKISKIFKVISTGFIIIIIAPIVDIFLSKGLGFKVGYYKGDLFYDFITFFGRISDKVTLGMKIEIVVLILVLFFYFRLKKLSLVKSFTAVFLFYCSFFFYETAPIFSKPISNLSGTSFIFSGSVTLSIFFLLMVLALIFLTFLTNRKVFLSIFRDLRFLRIFYYLLMLFLGFLMSWRETGGLKLNSDSIFYLSCIIVSIIFAILFSIITNNISDIDIDRISNPNRPLIKDKININTYKKIGWMTLAISLGCALAVNFKAFFLILLFIGNYFIYSMPPLRIKRVFLLSKWVILLNSLVLMILGFMTFNNSLNVADFVVIINRFGLSMNHFFMLTVVYGMLFLLAANFIDIKDYEGDKAEGIKTLPTVLGLKTSKFFIGSAIFLIYVIVGFLFKNEKILFSAIIIGCIQFWLINRKKYQEKYFYALYLASLLAIIYMVFK